MWSDCVVVIFPYRQSEPGVGQRGEQGLVEQFVPQPALKLSTNAFCVGLPGAV